MSSSSSSTFWRLVELGHVNAAVLVPVFEKDGDRVDGPSPFRYPGRRFSNRGKTVDIERILTPREAVVHPPRESCPDEAHPRPTRTIALDGDCGLDLARAGDLRRRGVGPRPHIPPLIRRP